MINIISVFSPVCCTIMSVPLSRSRANKLLLNLIRRVVLGFGPRRDTWPNFYSLQGLLYCHVFQWLRRGFGLLNRFIGSSLVVSTINYYILKITVTIAHVTSHAKSSNSSSGHTALPLEPRNSSEVNPHSRILSYPLGTDHAQKNTAPLVLHGSDHIENKSRASYLVSPLALWMLPSSEL
jgi:hypothetical protein